MLHGLLDLYPKKGSELECLDHTAIDLLNSMLVTPDSDKVSHARSNALDTPQLVFKLLMPCHRIRKVTSTLTVLMLRMFP